ncbi:helix-turn-helix domain-containing protein [Kangiella sediminilitoris]|uniref:Transcriptional regulator, XRE family n=1 Tax=Kangiella sediminilitoris TaxID=1144748 RepID=A0A1B3BC61_9GAMM|nr:helix-turn-helix domain-containing protein [Kangiella sediminilitoris]AOE50345.1 Transcriptional regulator, XRE family [Kangiella sediminilitoris]
MIVRKLRLRNGWSQEQLAEMTGLSARTIQRIERGKPASLESQKALASVFEVDIATFQNPELITKDSQEHQTKEPVMNTQNTNDQTEATEKPVEKVSDEEADAMQYVKGLKDFYGHVIFYIIFSVIFILTGRISEMLFPWGAWSFVLLVHGLQAHEVINILNINWEKKMVEKRLKKKL